MREILNQGVENAKEQLRTLQGTQMVIRINRGRNRMEELTGTVENLYPAIFTIRDRLGVLSSFSYADYLSKNVVFLKSKKIKKDS